MPLLFTVVVVVVAAAAAVVVILDVTCCTTVVCCSTTSSWIQAHFILTCTGRVLPHELCECTVNQTTNHVADNAVSVQSQTAEAARC